MQFFNALLTNSMKLGNIHRRQKGLCFLRQNNSQTMRLLIVTGNLGQKLIIRNACRSRQLQLIPDIVLNQLGYFDCGFNPKLVFRYIQISLVDAHWLNQVRIAFENFSDLQADRLIFFVIPRDKNPLRAALIGFLGAHSRMNSELSGLIIAGGDDTTTSSQAWVAADDDRMPL